MKKKYIKTEEGWHPADVYNEANENFANFLMSHTTETVEGRRAVNSGKLLIYCVAIKKQIELWEKQTREEIIDLGKDGIEMLHDIDDFEQITNKNGN